jgi:hypothetical protein
MGDADDPTAVATLPQLGPRAFTLLPCPWIDKDDVLFGVGEHGHRARTSTVGSPQPASRSTLAEQLEQLEPRRAARAGQPADKALVAEAAQAVDHVDIGFGSHLVDGFERHSTLEHSEPRERPRQAVAGAGPRVKCAVTSDPVDEGVQSVPAPVLQP